jgi:hypothetical protein
MRNYGETTEKCERCKKRNKELGRLCLECWLVLQQELDDKEFLIAI